MPGRLSQHLIYHPSSPRFDIPDYLPLRRVKPLPKRKRSSPDPGPDVTAAELIAHAEVLSAQIAFQSYFLPNAINSVADFGTATTTTANTANANIRRNVEMSLVTGESQQQHTIPLSLPPADLDVITPSPGDGRDGDHLDHAQQQGNAKKRKVPAHLSGSQMGPDSADVHSSEEETQLQLQHHSFGERVPHGFASSSCAEEEPINVSYEAVGTSRRGRGKMLSATMVGLRRKQVLKYRRRQLAALLGSPSLGNSLALDQALLASNCSLLNGNCSGWSSSKSAWLKSRLMRRRGSRVIRRHHTLPPLPLSGPTRRIFPDGEFTFVSSNAASERLIATHAEYTVLCDRFEHELARQAEKMTENVKENTLPGIGAVDGGSSGAAQRNERAVRKGRGTTQSVQNSDLPAASKSASDTKTSGKKKKRSALANASNPHHLRNYVPSRIPNQGHIMAAQLGTHAQNMLSPLPLLFLSAQIPPRRGAQPRPSGMWSQLANPTEEWICPTCEYRLFYGDEQGYRMGVRNRKKILKRRRRARERAAAAANGSGTGVGTHGKGSGFDDEEDLDIETTGTGLALSHTRLGNVERERGGGDREQPVDLGG
ncbi:hypothetical protein F5148DRAFT_1264359 [Russula earlei]|uniref:Uncharacterized protein n=1 Tax=Russula earlei TaxID=71964 RepID=A0ACC0TT00_9AGAM|nr:hypothetical protein F5148DRAFT_1264359 [Russula earlei]